ncbi:hypothetical protein ACFVZ8_36280, partial [Streptomyces sp. NPDC059558]|uniref:hypothetical protein n=1 Tax=Streptomyces sp. NPDC059558 TaxID=3346864 RepID=UPI0036AD7CE4
AARLAHRASCRIGGAVQVGGEAAGAGRAGRPLGGVILAAAGTLAGREWHRRTSPTTTALLGTAYVAAFAGSHPLAKRIGAWPAVFTAAAAMAAATYAAADRRS